MINFNDSNKLFYDYQAKNQMYKASYVIGVLYSIIRLFTHAIYNFLFFPFFSLAMLISPAWSINKMAASFALMNGIEKNNVIDNNEQLTNTGLEFINEWSSPEGRIKSAIMFLISPFIALAITIDNIFNIYRAETAKINTTIMCCCCHPNRDLTVNQAIEDEFDCIIQKKLKSQNLSSAEAVTKTIERDTIKKLNESSKTRTESQATNKSSFVTNIGGAKNSPEIISQVQTNSVEFLRQSNMS